MIRLFFVLTFFYSCILPPHISANETKSVSRFFKNSQLQWSGNRITGQLQNVPVKSLIEEILQTDGFRWEIWGEVSGNISISFDQLTVQQCIKEIMRLNHFSYALILEDEQLLGSIKTNNIKKLMIFKNDDIIRFSRTPQKRLVRQKMKIEEKSVPEKGVAVSLQPKSLSKKEKHRQRLSKKYKVDFEGTSQDLKNFVNELLIENRISSDEYEKIMKSK